MMSQDCEQFLHFVCERDPVIVTQWSSKSPKIDQVSHAWKQGGFYCLWNQALLPSLQREFIPESKAGPYYRVNDRLPVTELSFPSPVQPAWNQRSVLNQGRLYTGIDASKGKAFESWYNALVRWIRKNFVKNPVPLLAGYVGPAAYEWYKDGGVLLPIFHPPLTPQWLSWLEAQDQHRAVFSK